MNHNKLILYLMLNLKQKNKVKQMEIHEVVESGGLWLKVRGLERCQLQASTVLMPEPIPAPISSCINEVLPGLTLGSGHNPISNNTMATGVNSVSQPAPR